MTHVYTRRTTHVLFAKRLQSCISILALLLCSLSAFSLFAQAPQTQPLPPAYPQIRFGLFGAANLNWHNANFVALPETGPSIYYNVGYDYTRTKDSIITRQDTTRNAPIQVILPAFGLTLESLFSPNFGISARLSYTPHSVKFRVNEPYFFQVYDTVSNKVTQAENAIARDLEVSFSSIALEPTFFFQIPIASTNLKTYLGFRVGYNIPGNYSQFFLPTQEGAEFFIPQPVGDSTIYLRTNKYDERSGTFSSRNPLALSALAGIGYEIPIEGLTLAGGMGRLSVQPEIFGMWGLNPVVQGLEWNLHQLRAGISVFYRQDEMVQRFEERRQVDTIIVYQKRIRNPFMVGISKFTRDTVMTVEDGKRVRTISETLRRVDTAFSTPPPRMDVDVTAVGVTEKGEEKKLVQLRLEEFVVQRYVPLLNYVFFDDQSSTLHERYVRISSDNTALFDVDKLYQKGTLDIYRNMLNIIGKRLRQFPDAVITITGCNTGVGAEDGNTALSAARAEAVRRYLLDAWNIAGNRIIMKARNLSEQASLPKTEPDKIEENRRVEITSSVREVLDPILLSDTMRVSNPPTIRFTPTVKTEKRMVEWSLLAFSEGQDVKPFSSEAASASDPETVLGEPQENGLPSRIDWTPPKQGDGSLKLSGALEFTLSARDEGGKSGFAHGFLPVEKIILPDKKIEQFSLVLFGFNKSEISEQNQRIIGFINSIIRPNSKITIAGYTDRTGDNAYNRTLSRQRASELARLIDQPLSKAQGFGEDTLIYDNSTPEGRFYCRTVNVSVETSK
ncbi:MAG: OmpA family protein [Ignavibacteria bacterium]|nr:OmpA family protein [Ignavibacteria bacterium]